MSGPEDPVGADNVEVAEPLTVEILQQLDHLERKLHQSTISIRTCHSSSIVNTVDAWLETFPLN